MSDAAENTTEAVDQENWKLKAVREGMSNLRALWQRKADANESYNDAIKAVAEKANMQPQALNAYVNAVMRNKEDEFHARSQQMDLLFEEI